MLVFELRKQRVGLSPLALLFEGDGLIESVTDAEPSGSVFALGRTGDAEQNGDSNRDDQRGAGSQPARTG